MIKILYTGFYTLYMLILPRKDCTKTIPRTTGQDTGLSQRFWILLTQKSQHIWYRHRCLQNLPVPNHQEFQVPKMEVLNLIADYFGGWFFPYIISLQLMWGFLHFRYLKCLVKPPWFPLPSPRGACHTSRLEKRSPAKSSQKLGETTRMAMVFVYILPPRFFLNKAYITLIALKKGTRNSIFLKSGGDVV